MKKLFITIFLIIFIFGSSSYQELNKLAIITNIGILKEEGQYKVIYQEIIPEKENNKIMKKYKYYENKSNNLQSAFSKLNEDTTKYIYLDHLENIIIKTNDNKVFDELINYFDKDIDNFNIVLTYDNLEKIIKYSNNYKYINSLIDNNVSFREIKKANLENKRIKVPVIKLSNNNLSFYKYVRLGDFND